MDKAINFFRRELSDLERLMQAIESALERKQTGAEQQDSAAIPAKREPGVFGHEPPINFWAKQKS